MRKFLLSFAPGEPLALVQELPFFDNSIKLDPLLEISLDELKRIFTHNLGDCVSSITKWVNLSMGFYKAFFLQV
jgi:hypothetical protein